MKEHLIMFDLDGTLLDTSALYYEGVPPILSTHLGMEIRPEELYPLWGQHARQFFHHFATRVGQCDEALIDAMYAEFERFYNQAHNILSRPYAGVSTHLPRFREAVFRTVVVTTRPTSRSAPVLELPLCDLIDLFVWGDMVARSKPAPDGLIHALDHFGAQRGVYLGDNVHDMTAAGACDRPVQSAAALWGAVEADALAACRPDHGFDSFPEFVEWALSLP